MCDSSEVHATGVVLDPREHVEAVEQDGVDVGEIDGEDRVAGPDRRSAGSMVAARQGCGTVGR
jgi:hypothetical protein